ncbi:hypothetical protein [Teichococcus vastitatis]|uniref:hypothetical protein n=1 Tax=Teichococcus vastitatis TaxID=2307076 RepID=UPI0013002A4F|nr:hypothetical protein [Pseudoroseomonas vastitatis]
MSETTSVIVTDTENSSGLTDDQAIQAFLDRYEDTEGSSEDTTPGKRDAEEEGFTSEEHDSDEATDEEIEDTEDTSAEEASEEPEAAPHTISDDDVVEVTVDGKTEKLSIRDLKKTAGLQASLTRRAQELSAKEEAAATKHAHVEKVINANYERAVARMKEFEAYTPARALADLQEKRISREQYDALEAEVSERWNDLQKAEREKKDFSQAAQVERQQSEQKRIAAVSAQIDEMYEKEGRTKEQVRDLAMKLGPYALQMGLTQEEQIKHFNAPLFKMMEKAYLYDQAQAKKPEIKKVVAEPAKVIKPQSTAGKQSNGTDDAMRKLRKSGSTDDAMAALMACYRD